jgi:beta-N-acetylhexosaminidase
VSPRLAPVIVGAVVALLGACGGGGEPASAPETEVTEGEPSTTTTASSPEQPTCTAAPVERRVGLTLVVALPGVTTADDPLVDAAAEVGIAGVMLRQDNLRSIDQARALVDGLRARLGPELLVSVDDEGGRVTALDALAPGGPSARRLGREGSAASEAAVAELGRVVASFGADWVMAPVADLDGGPAGGLIGDRSFGADPAIVAEAATAFARGLRAAGVAVTAKHFPGHGGEGDPHTGGAVDPSTLEALAASDLIPFRALFELGAEVAMVGHVTYPALWGDLPASLVPGAYELLRSEGFEGVAITDALGMGAVHARFGFDLAPAMAVAAGADLVLVNQGEQVRTLRDGLLAALSEGRLTEARLDDAVRRVLALRGEDPAGIVCP